MGPESKGPHSSGHASEDRRHLVGSLACVKEGAKHVNIFSALGSVLIRNGVHHKTVMHGVDTESI